MANVAPDLSIQSRGDDDDCGPPQDYLHIRVSDFDCSLPVNTSKMLTYHATSSEATISVDH